MNPLERFFNQKNIVAKILTPIILSVILIGELIKSLFTR